MTGVADTVIVLLSFGLIRLILGRSVALHRVDVPHTDVPHTDVTAIRGG